LVFSNRVLQSLSFHSVDIHVSSRVAILRWLRTAAREPTHEFIFSTDDARLTLASALCSPTLLPTATPALSDDDAPRRVDHVLLISVDGLHAVDVENCVAANLCPNIAKLTNHAALYPTLRPRSSRIRFRAFWRSSPAAHRNRTACFTTTAMTAPSLRPLAIRLSPAKRDLAPKRILPKISTRTSIPSMAVCQQP